MTTSLAPGLARKVKKVLDTKTESAEVLASLGTLSTFYDDNSTASRRRLRANIEQQGMKNNERFLQAAEVVIKALDTVQSDLDELSASCSRIGSALSSSKATTSDMLSEMDKLQKSLEVTEVRTELVDKFLEQYQLTAAEVEALTQSTEMDDQFFAALERVGTIHSNCRGLLRTHHQRAGLELMDAMAMYQETAYERLCRWVQQQCRQLLESMSDAEVDPRLQQAVRALKERAVLYQYCTEEMITARHNALLSSFIVALTKGGPGGFPRPMEMHAHDARRYIGDMLAWVHQSLASERELLVTLFGEETGNTQAQGGEVALDTYAGDYSMTDTRSTAELLDHVFESICKPLEMRIDSVLNGPPPPLLCFKINQLLSFYSVTIQGLLGAHAQLVSTLRACNDRARRIFHEQLKMRANTLVRYPPPPPKDLGPPAQVIEQMHHLSEIMDSFEGSFEGNEEEAQHQFSSVLDLMVAPVLDSCERSSEALVADSPARVDEGAHLDPTCPAVYLINCLTTIESTLEGRKCSGAIAKKIESGIEDKVSLLVSMEVGRVLGRCNLADVVDRIRFYQDSSHPSEDAVLSSDQALQLPRIAEAMRAYFNLLSDPTVIPEFERIQVPRVRAAVVSRIVQQLVTSYELVYNTIQSAASGYDPGQVASLIKHTPQQVKTILGVE